MLDQPLHMLEETFTIFSLLKSVSDYILQDNK